MTCPITKGDIIKTLVRRFLWGTSDSIISHAIDIGTRLLVVDVKCVNHTDPPVIGEISYDYEVTVLSDFGICEIYFPGEIEDDMIKYGKFKLLNLDKGR